MKNVETEAAALFYIKKRIILNRKIGRISNIIRK